MWVLLSGVLAVTVAAAAALPTELHAEHRLPPDLVLPDTASIPGQMLADWGVDKFFSLWYIFALSDNVQVSGEYRSCDDQERMRNSTYYSYIYILQFYIGAR